MTGTPRFPLTAILAQDDLVTALLLCAIDPALGGVLVRGERGTAKTTAVRALAALLPEQDVAVGCPYGAAPANLGNPCNPAQDTPVDCCSSGTGLICPPTVVQQ